MIDIKQYREEGYLYDSLENYTDYFNFDDFKKIKEFIDSKNIKRHSQYDYWYKYNDCSYMENVNYDTFLKNDKDLDTADFVFQKAHEYQLKKIKETGYKPTWVFGTSKDDEISGTIHNKVIGEFQKNFVTEYYPERQFNYFEENIKLQYYDKGCLIDLHDDGQPINRICVFIFFLNTNWNDENGGNLILYTKNNEAIKIKPTFPNFVVLDSDVNLFHEVEEVKNDTKYNIVSFYSHK